MRVVRRKTNYIVRLRVDGNDTVHPVLLVKEAGESCNGNIGRNGAFIELVVLIPETFPSRLVGSLNWADLDWHGDYAERVEEDDRPLCAGVEVTMNSNAYRRCGLTRRLIIEFREEGDVHRSRESVPA